MPVGISIRTAGPLDAAGNSAALRAAFAPFEAQYTPAPFRATIPTALEIEERFAEGPIWVAESDSRILGTVSVVPHGPVLFIRSMAIRPDAQQRGLGGLLLRAVEALPATSIIVASALHDPFLLRAIRLYERSGFRDTGERADLRGTPLLAMAKDLPPRSVSR